MFFSNQFYLMASTSFKYDLMHIIKQECYLQWRKPQKISCMILMSNGMYCGVKLTIWTLIDYFFENSICFLFST